MRRANSSGSIFKMRGRKGRNRYRVRVTLGWEIDEKTGKFKQILKDIGYFATRAEAEAALAEYLKCPYDLDAKDITFKELFEMWSKEYFKKLNGASSERTIISAYRYCRSLYNMKMRDIRAYHLKECIEQAYIIPESGKDKGKKRYASASTKSRMKSLFNLMGDWAYEHDIVDKNYARAFELSKDVRAQQNSNKRANHPFTAEEIEILWNNVDKVKFADMVLIGIYSGWRPQELAILKVADIDLEEDTMFGGLKTDAGKNRCVPIHPLIKDLIIKRYNEAQELGSEYLFNDLDGQQGTHMTYDKYRRRFEKVVDRLKLGTHHPHETRHTFITKAKQVKMDEYLLKRIVGHAIADITENTYTHRELCELKEAMAIVTR